MFKVFPATLTHDGRKVPVKSFKWKEDCTTDTNIINNWSQQYPQLKFYGVPTGSANNILVLDVDVKNDGLNTIQKYHVPLTMSQRTRSGGTHYIFKYPNDGKHYGNRTGFDQGLDIRGENGYIIHYGFDSTPIANAPDWLLEQALSNKKEIDTDSTLVQISPVIVQNILDEACDNIRNAAQGESNNVLNVESYRIGQLLPSKSIGQLDAFNALFKAAKDRGKPDYEAQATINSGLNGGSSVPITCPFGDIEPIVTVPVTQKPRWTPTFFNKKDLTNLKKLRKPQIFKDWSTEDIQITTADGGTGKTTLKLNEAICLALGQDFLGFKCNGPGRTLFITGEDTKDKLGAMIGAILKQMGLMDNEEVVTTVLNSIVVKKDSDLCIVNRNKQGFYCVDSEAFNNVMQAVEDIKPKLIIFDPIASFWGSEAALNDMTRAVAKFTGALVEQSNACVEMLNHMGKASSTNKDMTQFAGRGGTGLPSHSRVSKVLRPVFDEEYEELTGMTLEDGKSAMLCNVNKFSDGSPLYNKPFLIVREGYLFSRVTLVEQKVKEERNKMTDNERIFTFIKDERLNNRYPTKEVITAHFMASFDKISKDRVGRSLATLSYSGHMGEKLKHIENPDIESGGKVYIVTDMEGKEL